MVRKQICLHAEIIIDEKALTAPLGIGIAGTAVHYLQVYWVSITVLSYGVVSSIGLGADKFKTFSA